LERAITKKARRKRAKHCLIHRGREGENISGGRNKSGKGRLFLGKLSVGEGKITCGKKGHKRNYRGGAGEELGGG